MPFDDEKKIKRLKEKEAKLVSRGKKAVDEGRENRADRLLGRAANVENRIITLEEKGKMAMKNDAIDRIGKYSISREFDGKEVEGTLSMKKNILGKSVGVEKFNFPNGGTRVERTVYNNEGRPIKRTTKDKKIN
jgi:hypothetical protein